LRRCLSAFVRVERRLSMASIYHVFQYLVSPYKISVCFFFSRNKTRDRIHSWRISNMRGIDGDQKLRALRFSNFFVWLCRLLWMDMLFWDGEQARPRRRAEARIKSTATCSRAPTRPYGAPGARSRGEGTLRPRSAIGKVERTAPHRRGMRNGSIRRTIEREKRSSDRLSCTDSRRSPYKECPMRLRA
jgi:hypothetical protein